MCSSDLFGQLMDRFLDGRSGYVELFRELRLGEFGAGRYEAAYDGLLDLFIDDLSEIRAICRSKDGLIHSIRLP